MNLIPLPVAELKPALSGLGKIINKTAALPVLQMIHLESHKDGWLCLTATDLDRFVTVRLEQPSQGEPMALLVHFDDLQRLIKASTKEGNPPPPSRRQASRHRPVHRGRPIR